MAKARAVALASVAAVIVAVVGTGRELTSICPVGGNNSTSYIVPTLLPYKRIA